MLRKTLRILLNVFGTLAALALPTMINVTSYLMPVTSLRTRLFILLRFLLLILLVVLSLLAMRKSPYFNLVPLYTSVIGFLISARMTPIVLPFFRESARYGGWFGGESMTTFFHEVLFGIPFACVALIAAILLTIKYRKKKQAGLPVLGPYELDFSVDQ